MNSLSVCVVSFSVFGLSFSDLFSVEHVGTAAFDRNRRISSASKALKLSSVSVKASLQLIGFYRGPKGLLMEF